MVDDDRVLTFEDPKTLKKWPYTRVHTGRLIVAGKFPKPFKWVEGGHRNLWLESVIDAFLAERKKSSRG